MEKKHHIVDCLWTSDDVTFMASLGLQVKEKEFSHFYLNDNDGRYRKIREHFSGRWGNLEDRPYFTYTKKEILSAEYCVMGYIGGGGYPQPDDTLDWIRDVYDMSKYCWQCGTNKCQVNDFRINKISKRQLWSFTSWVDDALFTTEEAYRTIFEPLGIGCRTVRKASGKYPGVLQLDIPVIGEDLDLSMHPEKIVCPECGGIKYGSKSFFPFFPLPEHPLPHIWLTKEYFGYAHLAFRYIIISQELVKILVNKKVLSLKCLTPCKRNLAEYLKTIDY